MIQSAVFKEGLLVLSFAGTPEEAIGFVKWFDKLRILKPINRSLEVKDLLNVSEFLSELIKRYKTFKRYKRRNNSFHN